MCKKSQLNSREISEKSNHFLDQSAIIDKKLSTTLRLVDQNLCYTDITELAILKKQIIFAKLLESKQYEYSPWIENKDICHIKNEEGNSFRYEKYKIYEENNTMEIIGESDRPNENSHEFLFDISNSNIMKKELTISSKKIRFNFHADAESISYY